MKRKSVIHGTKHDKQPQRKPGKLADNPAMKEIARMIEAGEVDAGRTQEHLNKDQQQ